jgi:outer membrane protein
MEFSQICYLSALKFSPVRILRKSLIVILVGTAQISFAQTTGKWNLEKCIETALHNNIQVKQAVVTAKMSSADNLQSKLNFLPTIDANANFSDNFGNGFNPQTYSFAQGNSQAVQMQLTGSLPIFTGLQQIFNVQRTKYDLLASEFDYKNAQNNVALNVASSYLQILLNREIEKVSEKQRELTLSQKEVVQSKIKAGSMPETAIYDIESQAGRDEVTIVNAKNAVDLSMLALEQLLGLKDDNGFEIETPEVKADNMADITSLSSDAVFKYAVDNQPSIKSADARVRSAIISRKISIGAMSPTLGAFASLSTSYFSQDRNTLYSPVTIGGYTFSVPSGSESIPLSQELSNNFRKVVGLSLDIPLFSKGSKMLNYQKARMQVEMRQLQLDAARLQLRQDIEQAYTNAKAAAQSYMANNKSMEAAKKAYQATDTRYQAGMASSYDIQQAKNNLIAAESELLKAKYTYVFRMKILDFYQGKPITLN